MNQREIKIRGWHTTLNKMFSPEEMGQDQLTLMPDGRGFVNVSGTSTKLSTFAGNKMIPMQFTGLKDKNGKEIYEGDVVKWCSWNDCLTNPTREWHDGEEVYWDELLARFTTLGMIMNMIYSSFQYEVIGNIYENPNLLKQ